MISVGSGSFWQQDQNFWARSQQITQAQTLSSTVIDQMFGASSTLTTGLASIVELDRTVPTARFAASRTGWFGLSVCSVCDDRDDQFQGQACTGSVAGPARSVSARQAERTRRRLARILSSGGVLVS